MFSKSIDHREAKSDHPKGSSPKFSLSLFFLLLFHFHILVNFSLLSSSMGFPAKKNGVNSSAIAENIFELTECPKGCVCDDGLKGVSIYFYIFTEANLYFFQFFRHIFFSILKVDFLFFGFFPLFFDLKDILPSFFCMFRDENSKITLYVVKYNKNKILVKQTENKLLLLLFRWTA